MRELFEWIDGPSMVSNIPHPPATYGELLVLSLFSFMFLACCFLIFAGIAHIICMIIDRRYEKKARKYYGYREWREGK